MAECIVYCACLSWCCHHTGVQGWTERKKILNRVETVLYIVVQPVQGSTEMHSVQLSLQSVSPPERESLKERREGKERKDPSTLVALCRRDGKVRASETQCDSVCSADENPMERRRRRRGKYKMRKEKQQKNGFLAGASLYCSAELIPNDMMIASWWWHFWDDTSSGPREITRSIEQEPLFLFPSPLLSFSSRFSFYITAQFGGVFCISWW